MLMKTSGQSIEGEGKGEEDFNSSLHKPKRTPYIFHNIIQTFSKHIQAAASTSQLLNFRPGDTGLICFHFQPKVTMSNATCGTNFISSQRLLIYLSLPTLHLLKKDVDFCSTICCTSLLHLLKTLTVRYTLPQASHSYCWEGGERNKETPVVI